MCGIAGIFAYLDVAPPVDRAELARMNTRMAPRGPDGSGDWFSPDGRVGFTHRRLAIIDLSERGAQPMHSADGTLTITFNGEIYNYRELRAELERKGHTFRTETDTEVLLQLYADRGSSMVEALRGMFAFGLWDSKRHSLLLARDPLGIKPLYYADDGWTLRFASQAKALLAGGVVSRDPDPAGIVGFHLFGNVPEPFTVWQSIRSVPAGSTLTIDAAGPDIPAPYYRVANALDRRASTKCDPSEAQARLGAAVHESVRYHLVADVPVAVFLSAGLDSSALLGTMAELGLRDISAVTLSFAEFRGTPNDETPLAAEVAARYGARHIVRTVDRAEFERDLPALLDAMDLPTIDGINTWFVSKAAHEAGIKVALSGLGADECFGGYPSFRELPRAVRLLRPFRYAPGLGQAVRWMLSHGMGSRLGLHPKAAGLIQYGGSWAGAYLLRRGVFMPWELDAILDPDLVEEGLRRLVVFDRIDGELNADHPLGDFDRVAALETSLYMRNQLLRDSDWAGMAHSIEIRVPYVDPFFLAALPPGDVLEATGAKSAIADIPRPPLPDALRQRPKTGFATPVGHWLREAAAPAAAVSFSAASRDWLRHVWQVGWTGPVLA
ncbi:asparagine synthase (glutamine-hydrolysing) [Enhydrobacter aerosaccus]|uniref:asparagine synthase (glutamine-hydrolyzing) n=1 Tax=Enhydrobacter aerosaccus TaxID=225324 RepID=A0A1T4TAA7_9HYPH|nr:asparagine synthase (glutamine-hydrolyzing) [Enhydrobacter aerosaccus]SKA37179.1 asparagine synthase (glutamine-hydrolysing) [Enhydrobacter aerosaccus]